MEEIPQLELHEGSSDEVSSAVADRCSARLLGDTQPPAPPVRPSDTMAEKNSPVPVAIDIATSRLENRVSNLKDCTGDQRKFINEVHQLMLSGNLDKLSRRLSENYGQAPGQLKDLVAKLNETFQGSGVSVKCLESGKGEIPRLQLSLETADLKMQITQDVSGKFAGTEVGKAFGACFKKQIESLLPELPNRLPDPPVVVPYDAYDKVPHGLPNKKPSEINEPGKHDKEGDKATPSKVEPMRSKMPPAGAFWQLKKQG
jgi:hypothetical protein